MTSIRMFVSCTELIPSFNYLNMVALSFRRCFLIMNEFVIEKYIHHLK